MPSQYCNLPDLYDYGLPRGGLPNPARLIDAVSSTGETLTLDEHGWVGGEALAFRADAGGSLPAPLVEGVTYYARRVSDSLFQVSLTVGGVAIDLTTTGARVLVIESLPLLPAIYWASAIIEDNVPGHLLPFVAPYPEIVRMTCAELAIGKLMARQGAQPVSLSAIVADAQKRLARWATGIPIRGTAPSTRANLAVSASVGYRDARGWHSEDTI